MTLCAFSIMCDVLERHATPPKLVRSKRKINPDKKNGPAPKFFKTCTKCKLTKSRRQNFNQSRHYPDGYSAACTECCRRARGRLAVTRNVTR